MKFMTWSADQWTGLLGQVVAFIVVPSGWLGGSTLSFVCVCVCVRAGGRAVTISMTPFEGTRTCVIGLSACMCAGCIDNTQQACDLSRHTHTCQLQNGTFAVRHQTGRPDGSRGSDGAVCRCVCECACNLRMVDKCWFTGRGVNAPVSQNDLNARY